MIVLLQFCRICHVNYFIFILNSILKDVSVCAVSGVVTASVWPSLWSISTHTDAESVCVWVISGTVPGCHLLHLLHLLLDLWVAVLACSISHANTGTSTSVQSAGCEPVFPVKWDSLKSSVHWEYEREDSYQVHFARKRLKWSFNCDYLEEPFGAQEIKVQAHLKSFPLVGTTLSS